MNRRRFLSISAAALGAGAIWKAQGRAINWRGMAFGAEASIKLYGDKAQAELALARVEDEIRALENAFSLYHPRSEISTLNKTGVLQNPSAHFTMLIKISKFVHQNSLGNFDPSIQPVWQGRAHAPIGFDNLTAQTGGFAFAKADMGITLNGIAQGYATDCISAILTEMGFAKTLVNMGEYRANHGRWSLAIENQFGQNLRQIGLQNAAIATSSPFMMRSFGDAPHILDPARKSLPRWRTISVIADNAALADGFSTALTFASPHEIAHILEADIGVQKVYLEDLDGKLTAGNS